MKDSGFFAMDALPSRTAYGYIEDLNGKDSQQRWRTNIYALPVIGGSDGGAYSTAEDMDTFWRSLASHQLLSQPMLGQLLEPQISEDDSWHYGYGVWIEKQDASFSYHLFGEDPGVRFYSGLHAARDVQITLMGNMTEPFVGMRNCVLDVALGRS